MRAMWVLASTGRHRIAVTFVSVLLLAAACRRREIPDGTPLYAPFNERKPIAVLNVESAEVGSTISVHSLMAGRLALRIHGPGTGLVVECVLAGGESMDVASPVAATDPPAVIAAVVPLDDPGRSIYREWAWIRRPREIDAIDAELATWDGWEACRPQPGTR